MFGYPSCPMAIAFDSVPRAGWSGPTQESGRSAEVGEQHGLRAGIVG